MGETGAQKLLRDLSTRAPSVRYNPLTGPVVILPPALRSGEQELPPTVIFGGLEVRGPLKLFGRLVRSFSDEDGEEAEAFPPPPLPQGIGDPETPRARSEDHDAHPHASFLFGKRVGDRTLLLPLARCSGSGEFAVKVLSLGQTDSDLEAPNPFWFPEQETRDPWHVDRQTGEIVLDSDPVGGSCEAVGSVTLGYRDHVGSRVVKAVIQRSGKEYSAEMCRQPAVAGARVARQTLAFSRPLNLRKGDRLGLRVSRDPEGSLTVEGGTETDPEEGGSVSWIALRASFHPTPS